MTYPYLKVTVGSSGSPLVGIDRTAYLCAPGAGEAATFEEALRERRRITLEFVDRSGAWFPLRGQGVTVEYMTAGANTIGVFFGGYITVATRRKAPGSDAIYTKCTCVSYEQIMSRRMSIARTWTGQVAGGIFNEIIDESLVGEGFTTQTETGPAIPLFDIQEPRPTVREALDRLCELASTATDIYYWDASPTKVARFFRQDTYAAPFAISDANPYVLESLFATVDETNQGIVNRVFVYLGQFLLEETVETFPGDSSARTFELTKPCGETPTITVDAVAKTVGIAGSDTGMDWYWTLGSNQIQQDAGGTVLAPANTLSVTYRGLDRRAVGPFDDSASGNAEGVLQGDGTGLYETILQLEKVGTSADAETLAQAWLDRYSTATITFRGSTYTAGLRSGQELSINLSTLGINLTMLIQSVTMTDAGGGRFLWTFTAIYGAARDDWKRALLGQTASSSISGGGSSGVGPEGPPGPGGTGVAAPNVTATAAVYYEPWANSQVFGFSGVITLPTTDPDYAHLNRIDVMAIDPGGTSHLIASYTAWAGTTIAYSEIVAEQPAANETWSVEFVVYNETGAPSPSPYTVGSLVVSAAGLTSVSAAEVAGAVYQDRAQGLHTVVAVTPVAGTLPLVVTLWLDFDDGKGWIWQGWWRLTTGGQVIRIGDPVNSTEGTPDAGTIWVPTNPANTSWKVAAAPGAVFATATPPAGYVQAGFTVAAAGAATATDVTGAAFQLDPVTSDYIIYAPTSLGGRSWHFYELQWTQPSIAAAPQYWFSFLTVQKGAMIAGIWTPAPDYEGQSPHPDLYTGRKVTDTGAIQGGSSTGGSTVIVRGNSWDDWTYPPNNNPDGTPNLYRTFRFFLYSVSRQGTDEDGGPGSIVLNACWSGSDHFDLTPGVQPNTLDLSVTNPATLAAPLSMVLGKVGLADKVLTAQWMADQSIHALQMAADSVTAANGALAANTVVDSKVASVGIAKLISGTVVFSGNVVMSRGSAQPVMALQNTGLFLYGVADGPGTAGLTSSPHVVVQSTGIGVLSSSTGPSVTINSSGITLWTVNASVVDPYVSLSSAAFILNNGLFQLNVTASQIKLQYSTGVSLTLNSAQLTLINGNCSLAATATSLALAVSGGPSLTLTAASGIVLVNGSYSLTATASSLVLAVSGGPTMTMTAGGGIVLQNSSSSVTVTASAVTIVNGVLTSPVITIVSGAITINIDGTNHIKVTNSSASRFTTHTWSHFRVENLSGGYSQLDLGSVTVTNNGGTQVSSLGASSLSIGNDQILSTRKTDPGAATGWADPIAQAWANSLRTQLAIATGGHGVF